MLASQMLARRSSGVKLEGEDKVDGVQKLRNESRKGVRIACWSVRHQRHVVPASKARAVIFCVREKRQQMDREAINSEPQLRWGR